MTSLGHGGDEPAETHKVELIGTTLRAGGTLSIGGRQRLSDYINALEGFFRLEQVALYNRTGAPTRVVLPEVRIRLDEVTMVGQARTRRSEAAGSTTTVERIEKTAQRLVVMTTAHEIYGYVHLHEDSPITSYVDATYPRFIPMTNVHVRWLADRRLAGRFDLALLQRSHIIGVATVTGGRGGGRSAIPGGTAGSDVAS